ncbi:ArsR/SmtB family transcription factor [Gordonia neofelifaecis]|uniref:Putative transcriptional regulator, ArsR family protein n=1 Tax=Gordonia neofelifaecis NRRL B-59395 TaxID=644548 RepID=F1YPV3_9ACTN|nr:metalloregulator ArsR/SmtB family transcription factor [Gordonia neofelifaecis]EGD53283.1 putative transcriptional regulator, ArsR family protein [Gordonia neofelifaecis NRRL B-59395]
MAQANEQTVESGAVADLQSVLSALADPVRLEMVRRLHNADAELSCTALYDTVTKATASHHFKILREAGVVARRPAGQGATYALRDADVEAAYPGLLSAVLAAANAE